MVRDTLRTMLRYATATTLAGSAIAFVPAVAVLAPADARPVAERSAAPVAVSVPPVVAPYVDPAAVPNPGPVVNSALRAHLGVVSATSAVQVMVQAGGDLAAAKRGVAAAGLRPGLALPLVGMVTATGTPAQVRLLGRTAGITRLDWADQPLAYSTVKNQYATRAASVVDGTYDLTGDGVLDKYTGKGLSVAIVDSGTDGTHPMFKGADGKSRVKKNIKVICPNSVSVVDDDYALVDACVADVPSNDSDSPSGGGHGTHVSGIAAGGIVQDSSGRKIRGSAPGADIVAISTGEALSVNAATVGLYWELEHHADPCGDKSCAPIYASNQSFGPAANTSGAGPFDPTDPSAIVGRKLVQAGVVMAWAAGNDGGDGTVDNVNPPSKDTTLGVISVANYDDGGTGSRDNGLDSSSSRGKKGDLASYPDISAPGALITSACRAYLPVCSTGLDMTDPTGDYNTISGTSMATPHIAGYVLLIQQAAIAKLGHPLTPAQVELLMENTAHQFAGRDYVRDTRNPAAENGTSFDAGHGLVDMLAAVARLGGVPTPATQTVACPADARFTDPAGDASSFLGTGTPLPSEPGLDVTESFLTTDTTTSAVTFHIKVTDLATTPGGTEGTGEYFDYDFALGGAGYYASAERTVDNGESYELGTLGTTGRTKVADLTGKFDPATDEITIVLTKTALAAVSPGQVISGLEVVSRRVLEAIIPDADTASGGCSYTIGAAVTATPTPTTTAPTGSPSVTPTTTTPTTTPTSTPTVQPTTAGPTIAPTTVAPTTSPSTTPTTTPSTTPSTTPTTTPTSSPTATTPRNRAPSVRLVVGSQEPGGHRVGLQMPFRARASDPDGDRLTYRWLLGDGSPQRSGPAIKHTYQKAKTYTVTLIVTDGRGHRIVRTAQVVVQPRRH